MTPTVTRLRQERPGWVAVELDGVRWRTLPAEAVVRAGLGAGVELDRARAALLARERRRVVAMGVAGAALARRELTRAELAERLRRRSVAPRAAGAALDAAARAGAQDDRRAARVRAEALAGRGYGDEGIMADLNVRGVAPELAAEAVAALEPERERAARLIARLGPGVRTAQALARRGFAEDVVAAAVADQSDYE